MLDRAFEPLPMKLLQCSACGVGPDLYQCIWLRALTGNQPNTGIVIIVGENWSTGKKPTQTRGFGRENMQTCTEKFPPGVVIAWRQRREQRQHCAAGLLGLSPLMNAALSSKIRTSVK